MKARHTARALVLACLLAFDPSSADDGGPSVLAWYPSAEVLPANQLKFYLHFSNPMEPGDTLRHFRLIDLTTGQPVLDAFRETELWDDARQRLTLWFHPGRQKTGVNLNDEFGPILTEGHRYELQIDPALRSSQGHPLSASTAKKTSSPGHPAPRNSTWMNGPFPCHHRREVASPSR